MAIHLLLLCQKNLLESKYLESRLRWALVSSFLARKIRKSRTLFSMKNNQMLYLMDLTPLHSQSINKTI